MLVHTHDAELTLSQKRTLISNQSALICPKFKAPRKLLILRSMKTVQNFVLSFKLALSL